MNKNENTSEIYTYARDLKPGQVFHTSNPAGTLYTVQYVRAGQARTVVTYLVGDDKNAWEMNIPSLSSCWVVE